MLFRKIRRLKSFAVKETSELVLRLSHAPSRLYLRGQDRLKILVDTTVFHHVVTHEGRWISTGTKAWGNSELGTGYLASVPVHSAKNSSEDFRDICSLIGLVELHKLKKIQFVTSSEIEAEKASQPPQRYRNVFYGGHSIFNAIEIETIRNQSASRSSQVFQFPEDQKERQRMRISSLIDSDSDLRKMVKHLGDKNSFDALHLLTAERHDCYAYLTMDRKFIRNFRTQMRQSPMDRFKTKVLSPRELGDSIKLIPTHPILLNSRMSKFFPVRSDLHLPDERRSPSNRR